MFRDSRKPAFNAPFFLISVPGRNPCGICQNTDCYASKYCHTKDTKSVFYLDGDDSSAGLSDKITSAISRSTSGNIAKYK